jgi:sphingomyelin phosphodiesterase
MFFIKVYFIYYTGDLPPHNVWNQSREQQLYSLSSITDLLAKTFPDKIFYSAVGNHEAGKTKRVINSFKHFYSLAPCNLFPTPNTRSDNITWLYQELADNWIKLGLPEDTRESIKRGGFYTTIIRPGLRLISLNMNYCSAENFWLFINSTDPLGQLQWVNFSMRK